MVGAMIRPGRDFDWIPDLQGHLAHGALRVASTRSSILSTVSNQRHGIGRIGEPESMNSRWEQGFPPRRPVFCMHDPHPQL